MRLELQLLPINSFLSFDYHHLLTRTLHKWMGPNDLHDSVSLYSFGWLRGGKRVRQQLVFDQQTTWTISFFNEQHAWRLAKGILQDPMIGMHFKVERALEMPMHVHSNRARFETDGMIVARRKRDDGSRAYLLWDDPGVDELLTDLLRKKMALAGLDAEHQQVTVSFDRSYPTPRSKKVNYLKGSNAVQHRGSECPVIISGTPEAIHFARMVGIGELTGSGFGALK